ncbi:MAG: hypothetical protein WCT07_02450 [Candidatus Paceibacterota bacterium]|jgi:uncharacterized membrane protein
MSDHHDPFVKPKLAFLFVLVLIVASVAMDMMGVSVSNFMRNFGRAYAENTALWHGLVGLMLLAGLVFMSRGSGK